MAVDVCTEIGIPGISPRISFSYDLNQTADGPPGLGDHEDHHPHRLDSSLLDSDFHFCFNINNSSNNNFIQEISPADELFSNGQILPTHKKKPPQFTRFYEVQNQPGNKCRPTLPAFYGPSLLETGLVSSADVRTPGGFDKTSVPSKRLNLESPMDMEKPDEPKLRRARSIDQAASEKKLLKEFLTMGIDQVEEKPTNVSNSKPFWKFKRSNSLNCDTSSTRSNKGLIRSLQFLSRSNSTGSAPMQPKEHHHQQQRKPHNLQRQASVSSSSGSRRSSSRSGSVSGPFYPYNNPVLRKCGSHGNGGSSVRVSPVLNIPPPCLSRGTVSLFGSLFCSGKDKKKKK